MAFVLASLLHSQLVIAELVKVGVQVSIADRLSMSLDDLLGLYPTYGIVIALSFLLGFIVAHLCQKRFNLNPYLLYAAAGGTSIVVALWAMYPILNITLLASARSSLGVICQSLAGLVGGLIYVYSRKHYTNQPQQN
ncbi:hypothetical protein [Paraglaciecola aestuariivivens]